MQELIHEGAVTKPFLDALNGNFTELAAAIGGASSGRAPIWVDTVNGSNNNDGSSAEKAFQTMAQAFGVVQSRDTIKFRGKVREQLVAPLGVYGVTIEGADTNPRHDLAASWVPPTSPAATTPLLRLREQGWVLKNFLMQPHTDSAAVMLKRREDATDPDASHAQFINMRFAGGKIHIECNGGSFNVRVYGCVFMDAAGAGGGAIVSTSTTIANPLMWQILGSYFKGNVNHIVMPFSKAIIGRRGAGNVFAEATTAVINLTGGVAPNTVVDNVFDIAAADFDPTGGVTGVTGDNWSNTLSDAIETGLPAD